MAHGRSDVASRLKALSGAPSRNGDGSDDVATYCNAWIAETTILDPELKASCDALAAIELQAPLTPEQVETAAVRYYSPMLCPQKSPQLRRLFEGI